jgi:hypothetical protein
MRGSAGARRRHVTSSPHCQSCQARRRPLFAKARLLPSQPVAGLAIRRLPHLLRLRTPCRMPSRFMPATVARVATGSMTDFPLPFGHSSRNKIL